MSRWNKVFFLLGCGGVILNAATHDWSALPWSIATVIYFVLWATGVPA